MKAMRKNPPPCNPLWVVNDSSTFADELLLRDGKGDEIDEGIAGCWIGSQNQV